MYSIKKVAELTGIPVVTIRAWENRYGIITPSRSEGGHRIYSEADIKTLQWLKEQMKQKNIKISEAVGLCKQSRNTASAYKASDAYTGGNKESLIEQLYSSLMSLNSDKANEILDFAFSLYYFEDVFHQIWTPVLYRIGEEWEARTITVAQEHFASQLIMQRFHQFFRVLPVNPRLPRTLAFCPEGEHHHLGLMLFSLFLRNKGVDVVYLGPNTPVTGIHPLIEASGIQAVAISMTDPKHLAAVQDWMESCRKQSPALTFVLGGSGFQHCPPTLLPYLLDPSPPAWEDWFHHTFLQA